MGPNVVSWYLQAGQGTEILQRQKRLKCADAICHMFTRHKEIMPYFRVFFGFFGLQRSALLNSTAAGAPFLAKFWH